MVYIKRAYYLNSILQFNLDNWRVNSTKLQHKLFCYRVIQFLFFHLWLELNFQLVARFGEFRNGVSARRFNGFLQVFNAIMRCAHCRQLRLGGARHRDAFRVFVVALYDVDRFVGHRIADELGVHAVGWIHKHRIQRV